MTVKGKKRRIYTDADHRRVGLEYLVTGTAKSAAKCIPGLHQTSVSEWMKKDWWADMMAKVEVEYEKKLSAKMNYIIETAQDEVLDRLKNGNAVFNKRGEIVRIPVPVKDAATVMGINFDKKMLLANRPTSITSRSDGKHLENLAEEFRKIALQNSEISEGLKYKQVRQDKAIESTCEEKG